MSMLAEPRRRRKWTLNPRGSLWANDDSKFGQKLMEKMGWSKGQGLGRDEQGMKEHLRVTFKDNSKGLGYKGYDDEWIKHYEGFEDVLANLNSQNGTSDDSKTRATITTDDDTESSEVSATTTSLEQSSKASRVRVHYHKFTRGKDLSRLSKDDLGCILGSKRAKKLAKEKMAEEVTETKLDEEGHVDHSMGVTTVKGCLIQDYFAQKMEAFRNRTKTQQHSQTEENHSDVHKGEEEEQEQDDVVRPVLGLSCAGGEDTAEDEEGNSERKKKKKKKRKKNQMDESERENYLETQPEMCLSADVPKKKKKRKGLDCSDSNVTNDNTGNDGYKETCNDIKTEEEGNKETRKKKSKKKHSDVILEEQGMNCRGEDEPVLKKKKKKKNTDAEGEGSACLPVNVEEIPKKKKKKKRAKGE